MTGECRNKNRGYQQLRVWQDVIEFYKLNSETFGTFPYQLRRIAAQAIASSDSVHRKIAEGYCWRSLREYLNCLKISLGCLGESVRDAQLASATSGWMSYEKSIKLSYWIHVSVVSKLQTYVPKGDLAWQRSLIGTPTIPRPRSQIK